MNRLLLALPSLIVAPFLAQAQVPNGGFETWSNATGTNEPTGWVTLNALGTAFSVTFAEQGTPGAVGASYLELTTQNVPGLGVMPSLAFTGSAASEVDGFPYAQRPASLDGSLMYLPVSTDEGSIMVVLSRWNAATGERIGVGAGYYPIPVEADDWALFSIPFLYSDPGMPDTASITIISSAGATSFAGTVLNVDDLHFVGTAASMDEVTAASGLLHVFPNPAANVINVQSTDGVQVRTVELWSVEGRLVRTEPVLADRKAMNVDDLQAGSYVLRATCQDGTVLTARFVKD